MHIPGGPFVVVALAETVYSAHGQPLDPTTVLAAARTRSVARRACPQSKPLRPPDGRGRFAATTWCRSNSKR